MQALVIVVSLVVALSLLVRLGLHMEPKPFPALSKQSALLQTIPLPEGLPASVKRFYRRIYGDSVPVIESAVVRGRRRQEP